MDRESDDEEDARDSRLELPRGARDVNPIYPETFRRHRRLLLVPIALATVVTMWSTLAARPLYESATSVWSDNADGTAEAYGAPPPAAQEQAMLAELLTTERFRTAVARQGGLDKYLAQHPPEGWGPMALVGKLRGARPLEARIAIALAPNRVLATPQGSHVLRITFDAPTPALAATTLRALVAQYIKQRTALHADALTDYRNQVVSASAALTKAREGIASYLLQHPDRANSRSNPQLATMLHSEQTALQQLATATQTLNQQSAAVLASSSVATTVRVVDPAEVPTAAVGSPKKLLQSLLAGPFAGFVVSVLGLVALARTRRSAGEDEDTAPAARASEPEASSDDLDARGRFLGKTFAERRTGSG